METHGRAGAKKLLNTVSGSHEPVAVTVNAESIDVESTITHGHHNTLSGKAVALSYPICATREGL